MRFSCAVTAACLLWAANGQAQYYGQGGQGGPNYGQGRATLLPVPQTSIPANDYQGGPSSSELLPTPIPSQGSPSQGWESVPSSVAPSTTIYGDGTGDAYHDALTSGCDGTTCAVPCGPCKGSMWFGSGAGMLMTRDASPRVLTTFNSLNPAQQQFNTQQASINNWTGGGQVMIGRWFGCGGCYGPRWGLQAVVWGLAPMKSFADVRNDANLLSTSLNPGMNGIGFNDATRFFNNAHEQRLWRTDNIMNVEVNALQRVAAFEGGPRVMFTGIFGARYIRFSDALLFGSVAGGSNFGDNGGANEAYLNNRVVNNLVGGQIGTQIDYFPTRRLRLFATPLVGVFGNRITATSQLNSGNGIMGVNNLLGTPFAYTSATNTVSMMGQIDVGAGWQFTPRFSAYVSYRAMALSRIGQADNQVPAFLSNPGAIRDIQTNGDLILHGAVIGGQWNY